MKVFMGRLLGGSGKRSDAILFQITVFGRGITNILPL